MRKILEFGRKAIFYIRVLSGYEERRIRNYRLQLEKHLQQAEERKAAIRKLPEQTILSEVRRMVEEMHNLNKRLEETEASIDEYFKLIDKDANVLMEMQLEREKKTANEMLAATHRHALMEEAEAEKLSRLRAYRKAEEQSQEAESTTAKQARAK